MLSRIFSHSAWLKLFRAVRNVRQLEALLQQHSELENRVDALNTEVAVLEASHKQLEARLLASEEQMEGKLARLMHYQMRSLQQRIDQMEFDRDIEKNKLPADKELTISSQHPAESGLINESEKADKGISGPNS